MDITTTANRSEKRRDAYEALLERCKALEPIVTTVAYPCEQTALSAAVEASRADSVRVRMASFGVAVLVAHARRHGKARESR